MNALTLSLRRGTFTLPEPCLYLEGPHSLGVSNMADFAAKFRVYLDDMSKLQYLDHIRVHEADGLSSKEHQRLIAYAETADAVIRDIWRSLGESEDSLLGIRNLFQNISVVLQKPDVSHIQVRRPFHAVVVAAGPSLELEYENLKRIQSKVLLVCVDAAFKTLLKHGITPHVVVAMERDDHSVPFFQGLDPQKTCLVCHATVKKIIFDSYPGPIATALKYSGPFMWLPFARAHFWTASSSAHLAYRLCAYWKAESIALVGQDLCFHPETFQSHAEVPDYPEWSQPKSVEERIQKQKAFRVEGNTMRDVYTDPTWSLFARDYQVIANETQIPTFNTSRLGMKIGNIPFETFESWIARSPLVSELQMVIPTENPDFKWNKPGFEKKLSEARNALMTLRQQLLDAEKLLDVSEVYANLPQRPHFLELVLEVVFTDWVKAQNGILNADERTKDLLRRDFLRRAAKAIERVMEILPAKLTL
jgi:hypothetical protein